MIRPQEYLGSDKKERFASKYHGKLKQATESHDLEMKLCGMGASSFRTKQLTVISMLLAVSSYTHVLDYDKERNGGSTGFGLV